MATGMVVVVVAVIAYALVARRLRGTLLTGPLLFTAVGVVVGDAGWHLLTTARDGDAEVRLFEIALVLVLFSDALAISRSAPADSWSLPARLLGIGLPLTILAGWAVALLLLPGLGPWHGAVLATVLAPTDAALGQAVVSNPRVPRVTRHSLTIESGLNDGLALPFLTIFLALALGLSPGPTGDIHPVGELILAVPVSGILGAGLGRVVTRLLVRADARGWSEERWQAIAMLALAALSYLLADELGGSGFIAVWVAGLTAGHTLRGRRAAARVLPGELAEVCSSASFLLFGALVLGPLLDRVLWTQAVYAVLSLTAVRMLPVAMSLLRTGFSWPSILYLGWFGPRGLASLVFAGVLVQSDLPEAHRPPSPQEPASDLPVTIPPEPQKDKP